MVNRITGRNTGFGLEIFKSVDAAIRAENKSLMESEQDLANEPTDRDIEVANKADKEAKKAEIENKMESIIDAMQYTQIDSEEAKSLAHEFQELQSELAKLELEEGELSIKEEAMKFANDFCKECGLNETIPGTDDQIAQARAESKEKGLCDEEQMKEGNIFADNSDALNALLDRATNELEGDELFELLQGMIARIKEVAETCGLVVESEKEIKEDSYEEGIYQEIEEALENAGLAPTRFTDAGVMTKNIGWELRNGVQLSCEGTWLDESDKSEDYKFAKGDVYQNDKGTKLTIIDVDNKGQVTYKFDNGDASCVQLDSAINMMMNNGYKKVTECDKKIEETEVKNIKPIKQQGNIFMLEDENGKVIVGEDFNEEDGLIQNAEVYESKEEADKDYLERCNVVKTESEEVKECDEPLPDDETVGLPDFSPNEELNRKMAGKKVQADGKIIDGEGKEVTVDECDKTKKKLADYRK